MDSQSRRDALAAEIRAWRRHRDRALREGGPIAPLLPGSRWPLVTWEECDYAARGLRGFATALPQDQGERARRIALVRAIREAVFLGAAPEAAACREIARAKRAERTA